MKTSTTTKETSAHIAGKLLAHALENTHRYLFDSHAIQGTPEWLMRVYDTVVLGGINMKLSPAQRQWLKRQLIAEGKVNKEEWTGEVLVATNVPNTVELAGTFRLVEEDRGVKVSYRLIFTLHEDFMVHAMGISQEDLEKATFIGQQELVAETMRLAIKEIGVDWIAPGMAYGRKVEGAVMMLGRHKEVDGGAYFVDYQGPCGHWVATVSLKMELATLPGKGV